MYESAPITRRVLTDVRYAAGVELVRECGTGLTLGDAGEARTRARVELAKARRAARTLGIAHALPAFGNAAYWLGVARELRTRRAVNAAALAVEIAALRDRTSARRMDVPLKIEAPAKHREASDRCRHCGHVSDWHDAYDGACPDDDAPHPYSFAADKLSGADPWEDAPMAVARSIYSDMLAGNLTFGDAIIEADRRGVGDSFYLVRTYRAGLPAFLTF